MKVLGIISLIVAFFPSCLSQSVESKHAYLFSAENQEKIITVVITSTSQSESTDYPYYDALIDFQQSHPGMLTDIYFVTEDDTALIDYFGVSDVPAMLFVENGNASIVLEGDKDYQTVSNELQAVIQDESIVEEETPMPISTKPKS
ncbi:hypothetical protein FLK61_33330 [Paenalkalicoccus suaedae]|uniref:Thioredoxin domain-containing protein n=1 Tax=Paenalkalicoccus suaedae TaxID=2592382 RepID=A0A859FDX9_9BACI|nr:hypothetical protein [Paenalkalicoccus suaedae]QKS71573.1 hypothetical protein FLK61_33330 [Paenalkalicoccus suaedae]